MIGSIYVSSLGKAYKQYPTRCSRIAEWLFPFRGARHQLKWVLQDINFKVEPGEAVGIIGINGSGKSTLLKLIFGTAQPTTGEAVTTGRIAAMLELGMGFHPDFTGRQNAFMAGQLIGLNVEEIAALMPQIEAFAEIGEYINQPVRVYSSGMQMRLAFSVATAKRPDVLIVDEILSVGDTYFQHKSFDRIREIRKQGTTLLIVSHDKSAVQTLCDRALLLDKGRAIKEGKPEAVMDFYNALIAEKENQNIQVLAHESGKTQTISGTGEACVEEIVLLNSAGERVECVNVGEPTELRVTVRAYSAIPRLVLGYVIKDRLGQYVYGTNTHHTKQQLEEVMPGQLIQYRIFFPMNFGPGNYSIATALVSTDTHLVNNYEWKELSLLFTVINLDKPIFAGNAWVPPVIEVKSI
jgi:lipopolysaccharide transport system ATP-binding protein